MKSPLLLLLCLLALVGSAQNYQSSPDVVTACRGYYEVNGAPNPNADFNTSQLTTWPNSGSGHCVQYIHFPMGRAKATLKACTGSSIYSGVLKLRISLPDGSVIHEGTISLKKGSTLSEVAAFDGVNFPAAGYYRFDLSLASGRFGCMTDWKFYKESPNAAYLATNLSSPSTHMWHSSSSGTISGCDWLYHEVMIPAGYDHVGTYAMAIGQDRLYMGIQVNSGRRDVIFSVWDNGDTDTDPNLPDYKRSATLASGEGVTIERFGNEGTGTKAFKKGTYWTPGQYVQFLVNATPYDQTVTNENGVDVLYHSMLISAWYRNAGETEWQYLATHKCAGSSQMLTTQGLYSFLENYISSNGQAVRKAYFRNCYAHSASSKQWYFLGNAQFSHTDGGTSAGARNDFGADKGASVDEGFFMQSGGYGETFQGDLRWTRTDHTMVEQIDFAPLQARVDQAVREYTGIYYSASIDGHPLISTKNWEVVSWSDQETSGEGTNGRAAQAFDDNENTYWHSQWQGGSPAFPHHLVVKAPEDYDVNALELYTARYTYSNTSYNPRSVTVEVSPDGNAWTTAASQVALANVERPSCVLPAKASGRYFRFTFNSGYGDFLFINELRLYGEKVAVAPPPVVAEDGWAHVESLSDLSNDQAYFLRNVAGWGKPFFSSQSSSYYLWLGGVTTATSLQNTNYAQPVDSTYAEATWYILESAGQYFLCNAGAKKFVNPGRPCTFTTTAIPLQIKSATADNGRAVFLFSKASATGSSIYMNAQPTQSFPVGLGAADAPASQWEILVNPDAVVNAQYFWDRIEVLTGLTALPSSNSEEQPACYDLSGRRLRTLPARGVVIIGGKKVIR